MELERLVDLDLAGVGTKAVKESKDDWSCLWCDISYVTHGRAFGPRKPMLFNSWQPISGRQQLHNIGFCGPNARPCSSDNKKKGLANATSKVLLWLFYSRFVGEHGPNSAVRATRKFPILNLFYRPDNGSSDSIFSIIFENLDSFTNFNLRTKVSRPLLSLQKRPTSSATTSGPSCFDTSCNWYVEQVGLIFVMEYMSDTSPLFILEKCVYLHHGDSVDTMSRLRLLWFALFVPLSAKFCRWKLGRRGLAKWQN